MSKALRFIRQAETGMTATWPSAIPTHHRVLLNTTLSRTQAQLCSSPFLIGTSQDCVAWFWPAENGSTRSFCTIVTRSAQMLSGPGQSCTNRLKRWRSKTKARSIPQASWAQLILWHRWSVFNIQLNFERCFIFLVLRDVFWWPSTVLFALQIINCYIVHSYSQLITVKMLHPPKPNIAVWLSPSGVQNPTPGAKTLLREPTTNDTQVPTGARQVGEGSLHQVLPPASWDTLGRKPYSSQFEYFSENTLQQSLTNTLTFKRKWSKLNWTGYSCRIKLYKFWNQSMDFFFF